MHVCMCVFYLNFVFWQLSSTKLKKKRSSKLYQQMLDNGQMLHIYEIQKEEKFEQEKLFSF